MAGHSKWNNIKRTKAVVDAKRSSLFTKISRDISVATKIGGSGDASFNPMLRVALDRAKAANMTSDRIQKAINKGLGISNGDAQIYENSYEAYGPANVPIIIDCETDNPNRTQGDIKTIIGKSGYKIVPEGSVSWQFEEVGQILIELKPNQDLDTITLAMLEIDGILDIESAVIDSTTYISITTKKDKLRYVNDSIRDLFKDLQVKEIELIKKCNQPVKLTELQLEEVQTLKEKLEEVSEIHSIWIGYDE